MSPYFRPAPNTWWLKRRPYFLFMVREFSSVFVAGYCVFLIVLISKLSKGQSDYTHMVESLSSPTSIGVHLLALVFVLYHSITWFNLTPKILVLYRREERIPSGIIAGIIYLVWIFMSVTVAWLVLGL